MRIQVWVRQVVVKGPAVQMNGKWMEFSLSPHKDRQAYVCDCTVIVQYAI